ncbi:hypothetical protein SD37_15580 [Amycolatopsis orientalis]|uniref:AbiEi antitoxin C-terminal domain-containing protein n=1 Tax=Amycolatopsis orientalis TaxID=31958 RepID=A0A193BXH5_AMYOR|nr:hypothetical protein [Amycolatopsis orientalis]ANN16927.1 hypothetical protein SD37_15580 [Amycolatopsis orientalis]
MNIGEWARDPEWLYRHSRGGVITVARLGELGVPSMTCYRRCRPGKPWQRLLPGVVLLHSGTPTRRQLVDAALLYAGPDAMVTGAASCRRQGLAALPDHPFRVHVLIPNEHKISGSGHVIVERTIRLPEPIVKGGVPLAPLVRSVLDECRRLGSRQIADGVRSAAEVDAMRVWRMSGLPEPRWNHELRDGSGEYIATPDGYFVAAELAWEIDSYDFHFGKQQYAATVARNARYAAAGIAVLQTLPSRLRTEPKQVAAELRAAHRAALARRRAA